MLKGAGETIQSYNIHMLSRNNYVSQYYCYIAKFILMGPYVFHYWCNIICMPLAMISC